MFENENCGPLPLRTRLIAGQRNYVKRREGGGGVSGNQKGRTILNLAWIKLSSVNKRGLRDH